MYWKESSTFFFEQMQSFVELWLQMCGSYRLMLDL